MTTQKFPKSEAIRFGWNTMKSNLGFFIGLLIVAGLIYFVPGIIAEELKPDVIAELEEQYISLPTVIVQLVILVIKDASILDVLWLWIIINCVSWFLCMVIQMGLIRIALRFCDNEKGKFADLFSCVPLFFEYLFGLILYGLAISGGIVLLIIPGIICLIRLQFFGYFIVDKGLGPMEALKRSFAITRGAGWNLFLFSLLLILINLLGVFCLLIGLFATIPITMIAMAFVYRKLLAQIEIAQVPESSTEEMN